MSLIVGAPDERTRSHSPRLLPRFPPPFALYSCGVFTPHIIPSEPEDYCIVNYLYMKNHDTHGSYKLCYMCCRAKKYC